jgi:DNA-binding beta-propeller fold protein YncE
MGQTKIVHASGYTPTSELGQPNMTSINTNGITLNDIGMNNPMGIALDSVNHRLFVADYGNNRVLVYMLSSSNQIVSQNASYVLGQSDFSQRSCSNMCDIGPLYYDPTTDYLFVGDGAYYRIDVYDLSGGITNGMDPSYYIDNMEQATGISYDSADHLLFVSDIGDRVLVFDLSAGITNGLSASYVLGQTNLTDTTSHCTGPSATTFCNVQGVAYDSVDKYLFVNDEGNYRVVVFNLSGGITTGMSASYVLGQSSLTSSTHNCTINSAKSLCYTLPPIYYDPTSQLLFVGDQVRNRVMIYNLSAGVSNDMPASYELGQTDFSANGCPSTSASSICYPSGFVYDPASQELYAADQGDHRVLGYNFSSGISNGMDATSILGQSDFTGSYPDDVVQPNDYGFDLPNAVALDPVNHRLFVSDNINSRILVFDLDSNNNIVSQTASYVIGQTDFNQLQCALNQYQVCQPLSLTYDTNDNYLIVGGLSDKVMIYNLSNGITNGMDASYVLGQANFDDEACSISQNGLCTEADSVYFDNNSDRLFVTDASDNRVLVYDFSGGVSTDMNASYVIGQNNFASSSCGSGAATLCDPLSVSYDSVNQRLFVDDYTNNRIQVFNLSNGITSGMSASFSITGSNYDRTIDYDNQSSSLLVSDALNQEADILYIPSTQSSNIALTSAETDTVGSVAFAGMLYDDNSNQLFAVDEGNNRVLDYSFTIQSPVTPPTNSVSLPDTVSGYTHSEAPVDTTVTDNSKSSISSVEIFLDSTLVATLNSAPFDYTLTTTSVHDGTHNLSIKSVDTKGNSATTQQTILVNNGDLNNDGSVNISDLSIMAAHWGDTDATYAQGSIIGDGKVNIDDLSVLASNWDWSAN